MAVEPRTLSARSTVLSLVLGTPGARMTPAQLVRAGAYFSISGSTVRAALTRAVAAGDLRREGGDYVLGERLARRQRHQDEAVLDAETKWDGRWEVVVVVATGRSGPERAALRDRLTTLRLGELREGVWARPANLTRELDPGLAFADQLVTFAARPDDPHALASRLWDLQEWAGTGAQLLDRLVAVSDPPARLAWAARLVRHLAEDPLLPAELLPADWPGRRLREEYAAYQTELRRRALA